MKKGKLKLIGFGALLLAVASMLIYTQAFGTEKEVVKKTSLELIKEVEDFQESLQKDGGLFDQVDEEMKNAGYDEYSIAGTLNSKEDIWLKIILPNYEVVTDRKSEEIINIFKDKIRSNNLDTNAFKIEVSNGDTPPLS